MKVKPCGAHLLVRPLAHRCGGPDADAVQLRIHLHVVRLLILARAGISVSTPALALCCLAGAVGRHACKVLKQGNAL